MGTRPIMMCFLLPLFIREKTNGFCKIINHLTTLCGTFFIGLDCSSRPSQESAIATACNSRL